MRPAAQTRASVWRGASPGRFLYGRGADAGIAPAPSTIVETRAGVAPRRPSPPPPFLPAPRAWDAAACANARQTEGVTVPTCVRSAGLGGRRRRRSDAPGSAPAEFASREPAPRGSSAASVAGRLGSFSAAHWPLLPPGGRDDTRTRSRAPARRLPSPRRSLGPPLGAPGREDSG